MRANVAQAFSLCEFKQKRPRLEHARSFPKPPVKKILRALSILPGLIRRSSDRQNGT